MGSSRFLFPTISLFILLIFFQLSHSIDDVHFSSCPPFSCGNLGNISYPFWTDHLDRPAYCGHELYKLNCTENQPPVITIDSEDFQLLHLNQSHNFMSIRRLDLGGNNSCPQDVSTTGFFNYSDSVEKLNIYYNCLITGLGNQSLSCKENGENKNGLFFEKKMMNMPTFCPLVEVPVEKKAWHELMEGNTTLNEALLQPLDLKYFAFDANCSKCIESGGRCGSNQTIPSTFACYCPDHPSQFQCEIQYSSGKNGITLKAKLGIAIASATSFLLIVCIIVFCTRKGFLKKFTKTNGDIEVFLQNNGTATPKRYSYSDVKKITNSFKEKLGKGGYGSVYKGKLLDGRFVAVKMLDASKGNGQEFINEVASISQTSHVNIVTLVGFCLENRKRALIYEFMSNGSLERFIYKDNTNSANHQQLPSKEFYPIAIGIARGLHYLHSGCNTRIVHFDIKPHNILLDENFCPKISDFGLAKVCNREVSFVSMMEARGTRGYIAPEVFCKSVGIVSYKSDVYSYGMMILEMIGRRKNLDVGVSQTSEIYFPDWIYWQLEKGNIEMKWLGHMSGEETEIARKMILVGLWCIQTNPAERPSMSKVIEMLEGNIDALQIPPKLSTSSPPRSTVALDSSSS